MAGHLPVAVMVSIVLLFFDVATGGDSQLKPSVVTDDKGNTADENSQITWGKRTEKTEYKLDGPSFDPGALKALFKMTNGFVDVVFPKEPPFDIILDAAKGKISSDMQDVLVKQGMGFAICIAIGILLAICVPFCGCCFCCCRCCGNCGGKRIQKNPKLSRCRCYTVTLMICTIMTLCGVALMLQVNERAKTTGDSIKEIGLANLDDLATFLETSAKDLTFVGVGGFVFVGKVVMRDLDNIDILVGKKVVSNLDDKGHAVQAINDIINFDNTVHDVSQKMEKLYIDEKALQVKGGNLTEELKDRKDALDAITGCSTCNTHFDSSELEMDADYTALPNILVQLLMVRHVANSDPSLANSAREGQKELDDIPTKVLNDSKTQRDDVRKLLDDFEKTVSNQTSKIDDLRKELKLEDMKKSLTDTLKPVSDNNKFSWYGGLGLGLVLVLIVALQVIGLLLGIFGYGKEVNPADRSAASNHGGNCLMASVGFTIIFFAFLMIFLILFFIIGAPLQKLLCKPLMDPEFKAFDVLLDGENGLLHNDGYFLGNMLLQNSSIPLTFKNVLTDCRDNKPSYSALKLSSKFDLDEMTDYSDKIDINSTMSKIDVDLSSVVLLSDTTETLLRNFSQAVQLDYQGFRDELEKNTTKAGKDLTDFIRRVREAANDGSTSLTAKTKLNAEADKLSTLNGGLLRDTTQNQEALLVDVNTLNATTKNVPTDVDNMIASTKASEKYIHDEGSDMVKQVTQVLVKRILATADQFASHVVHSVKNDLMGCKPLWNLWESIVHGAVCGHGVQTMNGFWFALGWSVFFMFFGMIFSVKTAKYFRKMNSGSPPFLKNGKVGHHDGDPTVGT